MSLQRNIIMGLLANSVPVSPYIELEWIESTGTQWIDTGVENNQDTYIKVKAMTTGTSVGTYDSMFGCREGGESQRWVSPPLVRYGVSSFSTTPYNPVENETEFNEYEFKQNVFSKNGEVVHTFGVETYSYDTIALFATKSSPSSVQYQGAFRMGETIVGDKQFIPVELTETAIDAITGATRPVGDVGMWDKTNNAYHGNRGTGAFIAGAPISEVAG